MSNKIRWGIIGPGRIANQFAEDIQVVENSSLYAVASRSGAREFVKKFDVPAYYDSYEEMVNDPDIDAVYVATPHRFHFENVKLCLEVGKPVLCEKPLTVNASETRTLLQLSRNREVFLMEALWTRFLPVYQKVREWIEEKAIGEILFIQSSFCIPLSKDEKDRWLNPDLAGGTLLDLGIYPIAVSQWIMNDNPDRVVSSGVLGSTGVDEVLAVTMQYASGAISQFVTSFNFQKENDMKIWGTKGSIHIHDRFLGAETVTIRINGRDTQYHIPTRKNGFEYEIEEAARCILNGVIESPRMSHADTLANMALMDSIREEIGLQYPFE